MGACPDKHYCQKAASEFAKRIASYPSIACRQTMNLMCPAVEKYALAVGGAYSQTWRSAEAAHGLSKLQPNSSCPCSCRCTTKLQVLRLRPIVHVSSYVGSSGLN